MDAFELEDDCEGDFLGIGSFDDIVLQEQQSSGADHQPLTEVRTGLRRHSHTFLLLQPESHRDAKNCAEDLLERFKVDHSVDGGVLLQADGVTLAVQEVTVGAGRLDVIAAAAPANLNEPSSAAACAANGGPSAERVACLRWEGRLGDGCERRDVHRLGFAMEDVDDCHLKAVPGERPTLSIEVSGKDGHPMFVSLVFGGEPTCEAGRQEKDPSQTPSKVYRMISQADGPKNDDHSSNSTGNRHSPDPFHALSPLYLSTALPSSATSSSQPHPHQNSSPSPPPGPPSPKPSRMRLHKRAEGASDEWCDATREKLCGALLEGLPEGRFHQSGKECHSLEAVLRRSQLLQKLARESIEKVLKTVGGICEICCDRPVNTRLGCECGHYICSACNKKLEERVCPWCRQQCRQSFVLSS
ncbi:unnamed protein product [Vitrella brassicaformis CCMP3155]|uniref:RING-type domain-containing protein n=1 Tax=Vitrella brassicaformis (strain CCMP3155) TaxID=1169540 RepID=A0A0G4GIB4_VITBC|nr:unnamed protein product [Vitrella brassicaformis CCMP3155]|eukprot:CEM29588.1 unnamed protein product [Vitrella brassicaformis CCMP3155]